MAPLGLPILRELASSSAKHPPLVRASPHKCELCPKASGQNFGTFKHHTALSTLLVVGHAIPLSIYLLLTHQQLQILPGWACANDHQVAPSRTQFDRPGLFAGAWLMRDVADHTARQFLAHAGGLTGSKSALDLVSYIPRRNIAVASFLFILCDSPKLLLTGLAIPRGLHLSISKLHLQFIRRLKTLPL